MVAKLLHRLTLALRKIAPHPESSTSDPEESLSGGVKPVGSSTREKWLMGAGGESGVVGVLRKSSIPRRPTRKGLLQFLYYNLGGAVFFASGYVVFALLYGLLHWHWLIAKGLADLVGWSLNYLIQHYLAFNDSARQQGHKKVLKKYVPFSLINIPIDYAIVGGLKWLGVTPFLGLWISSIFFTIWKWLWYKHWVFKTS